MSIGRSLRQAFQQIIKIKGQTILVHKNWKTPDASSIEIRGMKNIKDNPRGKTVFQFPDPVEFIRPGVVLQIKGARDLWRVEDTEDHIEDGILTFFEAAVAKINQEGKQVSTTSQARNVINIGGNLHGGLQVDSHHSYQSVNILSNDSIDKTIGQIIEAVKSSQLDEYDKDEAVHNLQQIQKLSQQEKTPGVIERAKEKLENIQSLIKAGTDLGNMVLPYIPAIEQYFR